MSKEKFEKIHLSVALEDAAIHQINFLNSVNQYPELYEPAFLKRTLYRYEILWLPLASKHDYIPAPLDIEWVWHCHMLAPLSYSEDCDRIVGKLVNHALYSEQARQIKLQKSRELWTKAYPNEPFEIPPNSDEPCPEYKSQLSYDIVAAAARQRVFLYQVSLPHYTDYRFLKQAIVRYKKYLHLKQKNPATFLVPCYDIDLIWHSHQLHPINYQKDTKKLFNRVFNHDDTVNDRSPNSKLSLSDIVTRNLWIKTYNETFSMYGAMYRGEPPERKLYKITKENLSKISAKHAMFVVEKASIQNIPEEVRKFNVALKLFQGADLLCTKHLNGPNTEWEGKALIKHDISTHKNCYLTITLYKKVGLTCCGNNVSLGSTLFDFWKKVHFVSEGQSFSETLLLDEIPQISVQIKGYFTNPVCTSCNFTVEVKPYKKFTLPTQIEQMWGPVPLPHLPNDVQNVSFVGEHL